jgi:hypothetical protein
MELAHSSREEPMIDLMAYSEVDRETEVSYIRKERDWLQRAMAQGRIIQSDRLLPVLPASIAGDGNGSSNGHGHAHDSGDGHGAGAGHARQR